MFVFEVMLLGLILFFSVPRQNSQNISRQSELDLKSAVQTHIAQADNPIINEEKNIKILFVGDAMFDRNVRTLIDKNGLDYPWKLISPMLKNYDLVVANLEGPVVLKPQNFGSHAMQFNFNADIVPVMAENNLKLVDLANNHTLNRGQLGLSQTRALLAKGKVGEFGDPISCDPGTAKIQDSIIFYGINKTLQVNCSDAKISEAIQTLRKNNPGKLLVVMMHWGNEYQAKNSLSQAKTAHALIDAGADLIIGSHPHVVQNIEEYKGKMIFYSLGNFIFDQYFSQATQQGLAISLELNPDQLNFQILPLTSKQSQPQAMADDQVRKFLADLAKNSSQALQKQVESGKITMTQPSKLIFSEGEVLP